MTKNCRLVIFDYHKYNGGKNNLLNKITKILKNVWGSSRTSMFLGEKNPHRVKMTQTQPE